jgi:hypothetical protein
MLPQTGLLQPAGVAQTNVFAVCGFSFLIATNRGLQKRRFALPCRRPAWVAHTRPGSWVAYIANAQCIRHASGGPKNVWPGLRSRKGVPNYLSLRISHLADFFCRGLREVQRH